MEVLGDEDTQAVASGARDQTPSLTERSLVNRTEEAPGLHGRRNQHIRLGDVCQARGGDKLRHKGARLGVPGVRCRRRRRGGMNACGESESRPQQDNTTHVCWQVATASTGPLLGAAANCDCQHSPPDQKFSLATSAHWV